MQKLGDKIGDFFTFDPAKLRLRQALRQAEEERRQAYEAAQKPRSKWFRLLLVLAAIGVLSLMYFLLG